jgi:hypothetical protein
VPRRETLVKPGIPGKCSFHPRQGSKFRGQVARADRYRWGVDRQAPPPEKYAEKVAASANCSAIAELNYTIR